jgi:hypothetical protein
MRHGVSHGVGYSVHPVTRVPYVGARQCAFVGYLFRHWRSGLWSFKADYKAQRPSCANCEGKETGTRKRNVT